MRFHLVHSAEPGCEPRCPQWIAAQGKIEDGAAARLGRVLRQIGGRRLPLLIDSNGGRVSEAFRIGRMVRARQLDVVVSRTELVPCAPSDAACRRAKGQRGWRGRPQPEHSKCASACAFVLAAGTRRLVGPTAFVGLHRIRTFRVLLTYRGPATRARGLSGRWVTEKVVEIRTPQRTYDRIRRYFAEMGVDEAVMPLILSTPADRLRWLTRGELRATGLATHWTGAAELLDGAAETTPVRAPDPAGDAAGVDAGATAAEAAR